MNKEKIYSIGLDVGSTTAKIAVIDDNGDIVYSRYERHNARVGELVARYFAEIRQATGDAQVSICVTGSVGMGTAEQLHAEFVQEVVAATVYARWRHPEAKALIDIGGEDAKVVFFHGKSDDDEKSNGSMELRMNGNCAGGTGAFIDQMCVLMGIDNQRMSDMALSATHVYPIAARCGVFAKTDIQNLMAANLPEADIAASIFHSIAVQTVVTLSHGISFEAPILLCGGPLTFLPALRKAFSDYLHLAPSNFIVSEHSNLIPALGCAYRAKKLACVVSLSTLCERLCKDTSDGRHATMKPLFNNEEEHTTWRNDKEKFAIKTKPLTSGKQCIVIGIDSGSTTTKIVALSQNGDIVFTDYRLNQGNPIKAVAEGLKALKQEAERSSAELQIVGSCSTGYGEELVKAAFALDSGIIETMAHERAATALMPDVSFILDIGGQDMKAIFVENSVVVRMELNEACSSGCGTFIQTFANNMGYSVSDFAKLACRSKAPCDLGTRCTVFMNSKVKQALREGASVADISAGISYSVVKNCLYKVLKLHDGENLGKKIVVQGGTMRNDAVVRAFELLTHTEVARSNMPELMGAYGCALHAAEKLASADDSTWAATKHRSIDALLALAHYDTRQLQCHGCENNCYVSCHTFAGAGKYYSGNKCERVFNNHGSENAKGENIYAYKYDLLFNRPCSPSTNRQATQHVILPCKDEMSAKIGIPRILNMYEEYPFWNTLLREAGFEVVLSSESTYSKYEDALGTVMSDNICFPAKLVHSHLKELNENSEVGRILMPYVVYEHNDDKAHTLNSYNCPIVSGYSDVVKSAMQLKKPLDAPVINFAMPKLLEKQICDYLKMLGVSRSAAKRAFAKAMEAQDAYAKAIKTKNIEILGNIDNSRKLTILLAGRPYHTDPLVQHKLSEMIASLGVNVISDDIARSVHTDAESTLADPADSTAETYLVKQWAYMNRIMKAAQWVAEQGDSVHLVQMTSFGCGPDSFIQDEIRDIMKRHGKPFTLLKIDDVSNIGSLKLRVRSLVESLKGSKTGKEKSCCATPLPCVRTFRPEDVRRKILAPFLTECHSQLIPPLLKLMGYDVEVLPMSDEASVQLGLKYANNEVCYPATLIVGDIIKALMSGRYDLSSTAVVMSQTGGQCRATNYAGLIKRAMVANGLQDVPLLTLGVTPLTGPADSVHDDANEQVPLKAPWLRYSQIIITAILFGDAINEMYNACIVRERKPGVAKELRDKYMKLVDEPIAHNSAKELVKLLERAAVEFDAMTTDRRVPQVGIVGEIFLKFNTFSHQYLEKYIISKGIEVVPPLLAPFFLQEFVNVEVRKHLRLSCSAVPDFMMRGAYQALIGRRIRQVNKAAGKFRYFRRFTNIYDDAKEVEDIVSLAAQFGEGWLLPADIIGYIRDGVNNVISLQPFGCIANHVVSKGIEKRLREMFPKLNLLSLDFDSGVSKVNITNRLLLFLDGIN